MGNEDLKKLEDICSVFESFRDQTVDGEGKNLHDIKVTFDFVKKTAEEYNLTGTTFGDTLISKVEGASNVLSELWNSLKNLETSIHTFVENQRKNNSSTGGGGGGGSSTSYIAIK